MEVHCKNKMEQGNLFNQIQKSEKPSRNSPLAYRARPRHWEDFIGQEDFFRRYPLLKKGTFSSLVFWGPSGSGKTTLAYLLAKSSKRDIYPFSACTGTLRDLKKLMEGARAVKENLGKENLLFVDEIHRFNTIQQDALLPYVEEGSFILIGATTYNPRAVLNKALLSRLQIVELKSPSPNDLYNILSRVQERFQLKVPKETLKYIADYANGDIRQALNALESLCQQGEVTKEKVSSYLFNNNRDYDKNKDRHYDVISAFIKSLRGSCPHSALLWLAVMLDGGEDPVFIARRMVIFASEDIGNADPQALPLAMACLQAAEKIGLPEARINLAQAVTYLASTVKSNASYMAIEEALEYVKNRPTLEVPGHLKNHGKEKSSYRYPHSYSSHFVLQDYTLKSIPDFYKPGDLGFEKKLKERLEFLWKNKKGNSHSKPGKS